MTVSFLDGEMRHVLVDGVPIVILFNGKRQYNHRNK